MKNRCALSKYQYNRRAPDLFLLEPDRLQESEVERSSTQYHMLSARDLAGKIVARELTPRDMLELCAAAITEREPDIAAFTALDLGAARSFVERNASALSEAPLRGLPVGVKDLIDTADFPTAYGSQIYAGHRPRTDAPIVTMTRRAGGVIVGKTTTTEFAGFTPAPTRNPHNLRHTPGGSSAGSAAAIAAGMLPLAFGSQTGGSIIRPASFCGVAGFKPTYGRLPVAGVKCIAWRLDTLGLLAARVADVAFAFAAISGLDLRVGEKKPAAPRLGIVQTHRWSQASDEMKNALDVTASAAARAGAQIKTVDLPPLFAQAYDAQITIQDYEFAIALGFEFDRHREALSTRLSEILEAASKVSTERYVEACRTADAARISLNEIFADTDALLTPSAPGAAPEGLQATGDPVFNRLWTLMGNPCVSIPGLTSASGLPLGVQLVGRFGEDGEALRAAAFVETAITERP